MTPNLNYLQQAAYRAFLARVDANYPPPDPALQSPHLTYKCFKCKDRGMMYFPVGEGEREFRIEARACPYCSTLAAQVPHREKAA